MADRADTDLARIKARESEVRQALARGETMVDAGPFNMAQQTSAHEGHSRNGCKLRRC